MNNKVDLSVLVNESNAIEAAARKAIRSALREHKTSGDPVVFCVDGVVQWVPAIEIAIADELSDP